MSSSAKTPLTASLRIVVVGAGMGGLATALACKKAGYDHVEVYEQAPNFGFVGAGIQLAPNMARILDHLECWEKIKEEAVELKATSIRRGATDEVLADLPLPYIEEKYGYPHMVGHRASLASGLANGCESNGVKINFNHRLVKLDWEAEGTTKATFDFGTKREQIEVKADVLLCADGVKSKVRGWMLKRQRKRAGKDGEGETDHAVDTGQAAYRLMLNRAAMSTDPELLKLLDSNCVTRWVAPRRHIIAYPIHNKTIYNLSTAHPDVNFAESDDWTAKGSKSAMMELWKDYCPLMQKMLELVPDDEVCEWKLRVHQPLDTWVEGNVALVGDACHATLPHMAQGAAQAIEDGAALGAVMSKLKSKNDIHKALHVYETIRKPRADHMVSTAAASGRSLHLTDEKAQAERDAMFRAVKDGGPNPDKWADPTIQEMVYGHDVLKEVERRWDELMAR